MTPTELDDAYNRLADRVNMLAADAPMGPIRQMNAVLSDWQDWFFGNYDRWPANEVPTWETRLASLRALVDQVENAHGRADAPIVSAPTEPASTLPEIRITAARPWWYYASFAGGALLLLKAFREATK